MVLFNFPARHILRTGGFVLDRKSKIFFSKLNFNVLIQSALILILTLLQTEFVYAVPTFGQRIVIAGPNRRAVEAGIEIARLGGNVIDVAVATELALAVTTPYFASLGGGGFAVVKMKGEVTSLDFREMGPAATQADFYKDKPKEASRTGGAAVGVPGVPAGLKALHEKYGKLKWSQLFDPAIRLAQKGFEVSGEWNEHTDDTIARFNPAGQNVS